QLAREDARVLPLTGLDLPEDWMGKHWACWQLAHAGLQDGKAGEWLLFTDADTLYHPSAISNAVSAVQQEKVDLLCALPRELVISLGEKLMVPYFLFATFAFVPLFLGRWFASSPTSFAIGQFLFFRRETYQAVGGHAAVRQDVVDDLALVRLTVKSQWRMLLVDGQSRVTCRMYHSLGEAWRGFSKNMFAAFGYNVPLYLFIWVWTAIVFLQPLIFITGLWDAIPQDLNLINLVLVVSLWSMVYLRLSFPVSMVLLYPVTFLLSLAVAIRSFFLNIRGQSEWKGRRLIKPHIRWIG
ncbi:MAG: hypothetical protein HY835_06650, partial [Anaerolineae bacterium]|nr:hypothetical protein [Anaerolineae bacterium]